MLNWITALIVIYLTIGGFFIANAFDIFKANKNKDNISENHKTIAALITGIGWPIILIAAIVTQQRNKIR